MVNHYKVLKVSPKASNAEIKSAYRRLARKIHPDVSQNNVNTSKEFARIVRAYKILGNPKTRADYDRQRLRAKYSSSSGDSVFTSDNPHARRWRQMAYERRYNEIIDRMIADERRESLALQKVIFPTVALFVSTIFVAVFRPAFFTKLDMLGKIIVLSLFVAGTIHLIGRLRKGFDRYTYSDVNLHESIFEEESEELNGKPYTRFTAVSFLVVGLIICLGIGWALGNYLELFVAAARPSYFSPALRLELIFYPPIFVLCVDAMHAFASRLDK